MIGDIRHFRGQYLQPSLVDPDFPRRWRLDRAEAGKGTLGDLGSHTVDLARFIALANGTPRDALPPAAMGAMEKPGPVSSMNWQFNLLSPRVNLMWILLAPEEIARGV